MASTETTARSGRVIRIVPSAAELDPARHAARRRRLDRTLAIATPAVFLALWQLAATSDLVNTQFFPAPSQIVHAAGQLIGDGTLLHDVAVSARRALLGFALGVVVGSLTGTFLGMSRTARAALEPFLSALYTVPKLALLPLLLLIFGLGELPKILLIGFGVFFLMWISTLEAFLTMPPVYRQAGQAFGANGWQMFRHITFPSLLPHLFTGMRLSIGVAVLIMVGIEFVQATDGIGYRIWHSWSLLAADQMYVGIVTVALMGLLFSTVIKIAANRIVPWAKQ